MLTRLRTAADSVAQHQRAVIVLAVFLGTFLLGSVYAFAAPLGTSPDEPDHWRYAYAVNTGQDGSDGWLEVPISLTGFPAACVNAQPDISAACVPRISEDHEIVGAPTALVGAPILYYQLVGWPLTQWPDERGILMARVLSALLSALLWAIAVLPWTARRGWLARLAVILTAAPATLYFSGAIQSSGMEIAAFAALWSLSAVVFGRLASDRYRSLPRWIQVAWPVLIMLTIFVRMATAWFVAILLLVAWLWSSAPLGRLLRDARFMVAAAAVGAAALFRFVTLMLDRSAGLYGTGHPPPGDVSIFARVLSSAGRVIDDPARAIGLMGWLDTQVPSGGTVIWYLIAGGIAFLAVPFVRRRQLITLAVLVALLGATWLLLDISISIVTGSSFWQARYGFPLWMGIPILLASTYAAAPMAAKGPVVPLLRWACALGLAAMQLFALAYLMIRYMYGAFWFGPVGSPSWYPYASVVLLVITAVIGAAAIAVAVLPRGSEESAERDKVSAEATGD